MPSGVITTWFECEYEDNYGQERAREIEATANVREWTENYGEDADGRRGEWMTYREISDLKMTWVDSGEDVPPHVFKSYQEQAMSDIDQEELTL